MGHYRYNKKAGWSNTAEIAHNFKGVDFYKGSVKDNQISADVAISIKSTTLTDVDNWLNSKPIKDNIAFLRQGLSSSGLTSNNFVMRIMKAEIHIIMQNVNETLKISWLNKLNMSYPNIQFNISKVEDLIKNK